jgi:hypothetical protein
MQTIHTTTITFPEIQLQTRDAHKLRGYFGNLFKTHSPLLHNHLEGGGPRYRYPLVQYKVVDHIPMLVGFNEGAELLTSLFLKIQEIKIDQKTYPVYSKNIQNKNWTIGIDQDLHHYTYKTLWMALNQVNYKTYLKADPTEQSRQLKAIATSNILAFYKSFKCYLSKEERILMSLNTEEKSTKFKNQSMTVFNGSFTTNALLPDFAGIGKSVSRGFGTIRKL